MRQALLKAPADLPGAYYLTPSLPEARPRSDRFRHGGRGSSFLAGGLPIFAAVVMAAAAVGQEVVKLPDKVAQEATCLNPEFLFYRPKGVDADQKAPLLIYLHGRAERGRDIKVIQRVSRWGLSANAFHAQNDAVVLHKGSEDMVAMRKQGNMKVKFTPSPNQGHTRILSLPLNHAELYEWLLAQERGNGE